MLNSMFTRENRLLRREFIVNQLEASGTRCAQGQRHRNQGLNLLGVVRRLLKI